MITVAAEPLVDLFVVQLPRQTSFRFQHPLSNSHGEGFDHFRIELPFPIDCAAKVERGSVLVSQNVLGSFHQALEPTHLRIEQSVFGHPIQILLKLRSQNIFEGIQFIGLLCIEPGHFTQQGFHGAVLIEELGAIFTTAEGLEEPVVSVLFDEVREHICQRLLFCLCLRCLFDFGNGVCFRDQLFHIRLVFSNHFRFRLCLHLRGAFDRLLCFDWF